MLNDATTVNARFSVFEASSVGVAELFGTELLRDRDVRRQAFVGVGALVGLHHHGVVGLLHIDLVLFLDLGAVAQQHRGLLDDRQSTGVVLIEWPDRLEAALPAERLDVRITRTLALVSVPLLRVALGIVFPPTRAAGSCP